MYLDKAILYSSFTIIQRSQRTKPQARHPAVISSPSGAIIYAHSWLFSHRIVNSWSTSMDESRLEDNDSRDSAAGKSIAAELQGWTNQEYYRSDSDRIPVYLLDLPMQ